MYDPTRVQIRDRGLPPQDLMTRRRGERRPSLSEQRRQFTERWHTLIGELAAAQSSRKRHSLCSDESRAPRPGAARCSSSVGPQNPIRTRFQVRARVCRPSASRSSDACYSTNQKPPQSLCLQPAPEASKPRGVKPAARWSRGASPPRSARRETGDALVRSAPWRAPAWSSLEKNDSH